MLAFLIENLATILISAVLLAVVILIILKLKKDRQKGCSSCGLRLRRLWLILRARQHAGAPRGAGYAAALKAAFLPS